MVVRPAPLPGGAGQHRGDGVHQPGVVIAGHQLHAGQAAGGQAAQERQPARAVLGAGHVDAEDLAAPVGVDAGRDQAVHVDGAGRPRGPSGSAHRSSRTCTARGPAAGSGRTPRSSSSSAAMALTCDFDRPTTPREAASFSTRRVDTPSRYDVATDRGQRPLGAAAVLQERREVRPVPQLRDGQLDRPGPGVPLPPPVAVAGVHPVRRDLPVARVAADLDVGVHHLLGELPDHRPQQVRARRRQRLLERVTRNGHNVTCGHFALLRCSETTSKDREVAASHHGDTPYSGNPVTPVPVTPYTTSVDVKRTRRTPAFLCRWSPPGGALAAALSCDNAPQARQPTTATSSNL